MFKKLGSIFLLVISVSGLVLGGKYVYDKQAYQLSFSNFNVSLDAINIYIPNLELFYGLNSNVDSFELPLDVFNEKINVLTFLESNNITDELYLSFNTQDYTITIKQHSFDSEEFIVLLENELNCSVDSKTNTIRLGNSTYNYFTVNDYFVFSTSEIKLNAVEQFEKPKGNYHYFIQNNTEPKQQFFKQYNNTTYVSYSENNDTVKGGPVSANIYYNTIPSNFDTLRFYGSSRIQDDVESLIGFNNKMGFFGWIDNSILHLKKDSFEILIGIQNEFQNLGDLLDEQTLALSNDSLLPAPIFKNNYEIHSFQSNYIWKSLIPFTHSKFNYYFEFNNYNILGNSERAMSWFITELQLGNVFSKVSSNFLHPKKINELKISQTELAHQIVSKTWTSKTKCFVSKVSSLNSIESNPASLPLSSSFSVTFKDFKIKTFIIKDTLEILLFNDEKIISYSKEGMINWTKKLKSPLISFPIEVKKDSEDYIVLFMKHSIDIIDENNVSINGFPFQLNSTATNASVMQNLLNFRLLIKIENQIININEKGQFTEGWTNQLVPKELKSTIQINKNPLRINYIDTHDSLYVINKFGKSILENNIKINLNQASNFISGNKGKTNRRIHGFSNPYIVNQLVNTGQKDSLRINQKLSPTNIQWSIHDDKTYLVVEEYNRVLIFNEFGLVEKEVQKPIPNVKLISNSFFGNDIIIFSDFRNKKLYLLDSYGRSVSDKPIQGESNFSINNKSIVVYFNSKIYIYSLETY